MPWSAGTTRFTTGRRFRAWQQQFARAMRLASPRKSRASAPRRWPSRSACREPQSTQRSLRRISTDFFNDLCHLCGTRVMRRFPFQEKHHAHASLDRRVDGRCGLAYADVGRSGWWQCARSSAGRRGRAAASDGDGDHDCVYRRTGRRPRGERVFHGFGVSANHEAERGRRVDGLS